MDGISAKLIDPDALSIIRKLQKAGFAAYVVGGGVRDQMLGLKPKDFDLATNAHPEEVKALFDNCRLIGHRFRLAHVFFKQHIIEVATFRAGHHHTDDATKASTRHGGIIVRDNVYGTLEEDAIRRDFTINALYYNPVTEEIIDLVGGLEDFKQKKVKLIGEPGARLQEDPVRILRAIRIANKTGFQIDDATESAIPEFAPMLVHMPSGRLYDEYGKLFLHGHAVQNFEKICQLGIFSYLFPKVAACLKNPIYFSLIEFGLRNTDQRIVEGKTVNPAFLLGVFLWPVLVQNIQMIKEAEPRMPNSVASAQAAAKVLGDQCQRLSIPRYLSATIRQVWALQYALEQRIPRRVEALLAHQKFRAAYDFLLLRIQAGELNSGLGEWWTEIQSVDITARHALIEQLPKLERAMQGKRRKYRRRR